MTYFLFLGLICIINIISPSLGNAIKDNNDSLVLVHTIFRHGNRTIEDPIYPGNPYGSESYYKPYGYGQLSNVGKKTEYEIGEALRNKYDELLGEEYNVNVLEAWSTNVNRTQMSLLMVLASLYPPEKDLVWDNRVYWQPIPYKYSDQNKELSAAFVCKNFKTEYNKVYNSEKVQAQLSTYNDVFKYLSENTNETISIKDASDLYVELKAQESYGYPLEDWVRKYYPSTLEKIALDYYFLQTNTTTLRKILAGFLIRKILSDTKNKIEGQDEDKKIYLYSAHEKNLGSLLITLGVFDNHVPNFGAYIVFEVHNIKGVYGFKVFYQNYKQQDPILVTLPGCSEFCSIADFENLLKEYIPQDSDCKM